MLFVILNTTLILTRLSVHRFFRRLSFQQLVLHFTVLPPLIVDCVEGMAAP
jgi:hypothetical protein